MVYVIMLIGKVYWYSQLKAWHILKLRYYDNNDIIDIFNLLIF